MSEPESFEWDQKKESQNIKKHGVDFITATEAFKDPWRIIAEDTKHGRNEIRHYCIGKVNKKVLTVRYTYRNQTVRIFGAVVTGEKEKNSMKKRIHDPNMPIGELKRIKDYLPPPEKLVFPQRTKKITIALSEHSLNFFKHQAKKNKTQYQKMIRSLLDHYAMISH